MDYNPYQGFFWPVLTTDIRSCSQCQKVCFFPNLNKKIPNSRNKKKKTGEKITKYHHFTMFMFVVERAGPNSPNDTREITKYCKLPNGNVPLRQFSRIYSRRCRGVCNKHTGGKFNNASALGRSLYWCQALHIMNKDRNQSTSAQRALALLNSPMVYFTGTLLWRINLD